LLTLSTPPPHAAFHTPQGIDISVNRPANYKAANPEYTLWFETKGKRQTFYFDETDYGMHFRQALEAQGVPEETLQRCAAAVWEANRCSFLHVGFATGIHPFSLQACYRRESRRRIAASEEALAAAVTAAEENPGNTLLEEAATMLMLSDPVYLYEPVLRRGDMIDIDVLEAIWPEELASTRICVVVLVVTNYYNLECRLDQIVVYTPDNPACVNADGQWTGTDVIIKKQDVHFTQLVPQQEKNLQQLGIPCIDSFLVFARNITVSPGVHLPIHMKTVAVSEGVSVYPEGMPVAGAVGADAARAQALEVRLAAVEQASSALDSRVGAAEADVAALT
jgi:hypothetical protein